MSIKSFVSDYAIATFGAVVFLVLASICLLLNCVIKSDRMKYARMINEIPVNEIPVDDSTAKITSKKSKKQSLDSTSLGEPSTALSSTPSIVCFIDNKFVSSNVKELYLDMVLRGELGLSGKNKVKELYGLVKPEQK